MQEQQAVRVAIIGAGVAGLSAAHELIGRGETSFAVLEAGAEVGGRTRMSRIAGEHVPGGAGVVYVGTESDAFCERHGIERFPIRPAIYCVHYDGVTVTAANDSQLVAGLPFSAPAKQEFAALLASLRADYDRLVDFGLTEASDSLAETTFETYLGDVQHAEIREFLSAVVHAACHLRPSEISAKYALRYFLSKVFRDANQSSYIPKGMQEIAFKLNEFVSDHVRLCTRVNSIVPNPEGYTIFTERNGAVEKISAQSVVMAVAGPAVKGIAPWLPDWKLAAIEGVGGTPQLVLSVVLQHEGDWEWEGVFMTPVLGLAFEWVTDCRAGTGLTRNRTTLQMGVGRNAAFAAFDRSDDEIIAEWIADLDKVFPGTAARVVAAEVHRWELCFAVLRADRHLYQEDAARPVNRMYFAGDYASATAGVHGCLATGRLAGANAFASFEGDVHTLTL